MTKPITQKNHDKEIEKAEKALEKLRKKFMSVPFSYTTTWDNGEEYTSLGKFDAINGSFNLNKFKFHNIEEYTQMVSSETMFSFPDGSTKTFNFSKDDGGLDFEDMELNPKGLLPEFYENLIELRKMELDVNMLKNQKTHQEPVKDNQFKI